LIVILICAEPGLALRLGRLITGRRIYAVTIADVVRLAGEHQPVVVLLDVKMGGSIARAVEAVPRIQKAAASCAVIVVTCAPTGAEIREADGLGAYDCIDRLSDGFMLRLQQAIALAQATQPQRSQDSKRAVH
jgi:DNA-binding NarL/FixJ family response regulator